MTNHPTGIRIVGIGTIVTLMILLVGSAYTSVSGSSPVDYHFGFTGQPGSPAPFESDGWDVQVHKRDHNHAPGQMDPMHAQHGPGCEGPDVTHHISKVEEVAFLCRDHVMTAVNAGDYGLAYLTPDHMVDFSGGEAVIEIDVSTFRASTRDWWDIWVTPPDDFMTRPFDNFDVDLQGPPRNGLKVGLIQENVLCITEYRNGERVTPGNMENGCAWWEPYENWLDPDKARRDTFELRISRNEVSIGMPDYGRTFHTWKPSSPIQWTQGMVQFGHHSYTPTKDGAGQPATWHWDNARISPAVPVEMVHTTGGYHEYLREDWQSSCGDCSVTLEKPAPSNSTLYFSHWGADAVELNYGNGWERPEPVVPVRRREHAASYSHPIPAGTTDIQFRFGDSGAPLMSTGFVVLSQDGTSSGPAPTPTTEPTAEPTSEPTSAPEPTATPDEAPAEEPTATPTTEPEAPDDSEREPGSLDRMSWLGEDWYLHGANVPWLNWQCDFGCGSDGGVSSSASQAALHERFAEAEAAGIKNIRWWVFPGAPWQINRSSNGTPTGINESVFADMDAALELAEEYDMYLTLVLFSDGGSLPGSWRTDAGQRAELANVLGDDLFARYRGHDHIFSWEVFNEPEWQIWEGSVQESHMQDLVKRVASAVKTDGSGYVTVGSAMVDGIPMWKDAGLDYYQPHWYDYMGSGNWCAWCTTADEIRQRYGVDKPIVIGEFFAGPSVDAEGRFDGFRERGYAGAWPWSLFAERTDDRMEVDLDASTAFASAVGDIGPQASGGSGPAPTNTPAPEPTSTPTPAPTSTPTTVPTSTPQPANDFDSSASGRVTDARFSIPVSSEQSGRYRITGDIIGPGGNVVASRTWDRQSFSAGQTRSYSMNWAVPSNAQEGTYDLRVRLNRVGNATVLYEAEHTGVLVLQ